MSLKGVLRIQLSSLRSLFDVVLVQRNAIYLACLVIGLSAFDACQGKICGGQITNSTGVIKSPETYSATPSNSLTCTWTIIAEQYQTIMLTFTLFNVMMGTAQNDCDRDYVEVMDGDRTLGKYCNSRLKYPTKTITSKSSSITLIFKAIGSPYGGKKSFFQASFKSHCGGFLTTSKGEIKSPNYPRPYPVPQDCVWRIQVARDSVIRLFFLEFKLETSSLCNRDYLKAMDGLNSTSRLMGHFCASRQYPTELRSTSNAMMLAFKSSTQTLTGVFRLYYEAEPHCGGTLRGKSGSFSSPGYGSLVHSTIPHDCRWTIYVPPGMAISVVFASFDVKSSPKCLNDFVEIIDGSESHATSMGRYCGRDVVNPPTVHSTKNTMVIILHRSTDSGKGFFATYTAVNPKNPYDNCEKSADELLYRCHNGNYIQCQWKCDGTDDCGDHSDEQNCDISTIKPAKNDHLTSYVIILVSITGSAVLIAILIFIIDRLRRKRRSQASSRRRRRRRARLRPFDTDRGEGVSPPPTYDFAVSVSNCCDTSSLPPSYVESVATATASEGENDDTAESACTALARSDAVQDVSTSDDPPPSDGPFNEEAAVNDDVNVECVSLSESPPSDDTSPLLV